jgi:hypothetical protein
MPKKLSLSPLKFREAVTDILQVKPQPKGKLKASAERKKKKGK